jgi:hypothetical protein
MSQALLDMLAQDGSDMLSNRDLSRRTGLDQKYIAGYRAALAAQECAAPRQGTMTVDEVRRAPTASPPPLATPLKPSGTLSTPGCTVAGEPPALNSWDCWCRASARERMKFVDAVGLFHLLDAAPADHRAHFLRTIRAETAEPATNTATAHADLAADCAIPEFLQHAARHQTARR